MLGTMTPMLVSMDRAGRVVIPKELREQLDLGPEPTFTLELEGDTLRLTPSRRPGRAIREVDGWPVLAASSGLHTTDLDVQRWRDADQR